jgi:hypothetical protein
MSYVVGRMGFEPVILVGGTGPNISLVRSAARAGKRDPANSRKSRRGAISGSARWEIYGSTSERNARF